MMLRRLLLRIIRDSIARTDPDALALVVAIHVVQATPGLRRDLFNPIWVHVDQFDAACAALREVRGRLYAILAARRRVAA